jgi:hypothetical protein
VGAWYTIGVALGWGLGVGVILSGVLGVSARGLVVAAVLAAAVGAAFMLPLGTAQAIAGGVGGIVGAVTASVAVRGALRRGATRRGVAAYMAGIGLLLIVLGGVPVLGYVEAVVLLVLAARMRTREPERHAGLRTLAK